MHYILTTQSPHICCRSVRYSIASFAKTSSSSHGDTGVVVRLLADTLYGRCGHDAALNVVIANNTAEEIFIPFSHELDGERLEIYPWRLLYDSATAKPVRLARQLQYNDMIERQDALLRFFKLPAGREVRLSAVIPARWLCAPTTAVTAEYLGYELNPVFYADHSRNLRGKELGRDPDLRTSIGLRFDVAFSSFRFLDALPVLSRKTNPAGDTTEIRVGVKEEAGQYLDDAQHVTGSNEVVLRIEG